jgi:hypothetical protein
MGKLVHLAMPVWLGIVIACMCGAVGWQLSGSDDGGTVGTPVTGVVDSIDPDSGTVCIGRPGGSELVDCFAAPGLALRPGDSVSVRVTPMLIDPSDPGKGTIATITSIASD